MHGKILVIAGSDSGGGAGIQADLKTINNLGAYATTAITALTAQNSQAVREILPISIDFITTQITTICSDISIDSIKIGMVYNFNILNEIIIILRKLLPDTPIILDPVMIATSGAALAQTDVESLNILRSNIISNCYLITPNIAEAKAISNMEITNLNEMINAGKYMQKLGAKNILIKGSHIDSSEINDVLIMQDSHIIFESKRIKHNNNHGSGCSLASAIATFIAQKAPLEQAVANARTYVYKAIEHAIIPGNGNGTLNHCLTKISAV